jgi:methanogenic corrinoid protein MtbC1
MIPIAPNNAWPDIRAQLMEHLSAVNLGQAHLLVNGICTMFPVETVILELFEPIMVLTGELWNRGEICIAEEHVISNFVRQRLLGLIQLHAPFARGPRLICGCAPDEHHELGLLMFALLMEQRGWEVVYLGQSVASEGLESFLMRLSPALVCVSVSLAERMAGMQELCKIVSSLQHRRLRAAYSGRVFDYYPELRERIPGTYLGNDLRLAVLRADELGESVDPDRWYSMLAAQPRSSVSSNAIFAD